MAKKVLKELEKLDKEKIKDFIELESEKQKFIEEIKKSKKEDIIPQPPKKLSLWNRIKKVLMGL
jgi:hypothetical protein